MTLARSQIVSLDATPYYNCISRCVRRAFLCSIDPYSGQDYSHRRQLIVDRLRFLASVFAVEVCSYAIMSNHYHLVIRIRKDTAENWSDDHVLKQWFKLYKPDIHLINVYRKGVQLGKAERAFVKQWIQERRDILYSMSRFMQCLNPIKT